MEILKAAYNQIKTKFQSAIPALETNSFLGVNMYDDKYRVIRTYSENYLGGDDLLLTKYDFIGNVLKTRQIHVKQSGSTPVIINQQFEYDHANRLKQVYHQIEGNGDPVLIAEMEYNELGQVIKKKLNENVDGSFLQEIDYEYNIRGWRTKINDPAELQKPGEPKDMFAMELLYNDVISEVNNTGDEQYNGNIAAVRWNTPEFGLKAYGYGYDNINRLERAKFAAGAALNIDVDKYSVENITYDANGNILTLGRHNTAAGFIDNLAMDYNGNQLKKAYDSGNINLGFVDGIDAETEYHYDLNGNMDVDDNKGITFAYNQLNLPEEIVGGNDTVRYIYSAAGKKISKELVQGGAIGYTDYIGNFVYKDGELDYISMNEGRITQPTTGTFQYEYFLKDHLSNTRTVFADGNNDGVLADNEVLQETHYYPYGMSIGDLAVDRGTDNKIKFGGKEFQDDDLNGVSLALYDYDSRFRMDDIPVFTTIDPLAEQFYDWSPYVYALDNPIRFIDPDGQAPQDPNNPIGQKKTTNPTSKAIMIANAKGQAASNIKRETTQILLDMHYGGNYDNVSQEEYQSKATDILNRIDVSVTNDQVNVTIDGSISNSTDGKIKEDLKGNVEGKVKGKITDKAIDKAVKKKMITKAAGKVLGSTLSVVSNVLDAVPVGDATTDSRNETNTAITIQVGLSSEQVSGQIQDVITKETENLSNTIQNIQNQ